MDLENSLSIANLPRIPHLRIGTSGALELACLSPDRGKSILAAGKENYGMFALIIGDIISQRWLAASENPYQGEIAAIAAYLGAPGVFLLNLSYEWTCTSGIAPDPSGSGNRMLRTLDWPLKGLGKNVVVATMEGLAGIYENITWPGFAGVVTAMAPGRFSAAINQPPTRYWTPFPWMDWGINRYRLWRRRAMPPAHLLRRVFDNCYSYKEAKKMLVETPISMPVFFILSGIKPGEGCIIERDELTAFIREGPASASNHWVSGNIPSRNRGFDSLGRYQLMEGFRGQISDDFAWLQPPILNSTTRLAVVAIAYRGGLSVQGWEPHGPATQVFYTSSIR